jgi:hypothetical protein
MMKIYDIIFYASYKLGKKSKNFNDIPALGGVIFVSSNILLNIGAIALFLERLLKISIWNFSNERYSLGRVILGILIVILPMIYYSWGGRYKKIVEEYDKKNLLIPSWLIIVLSMVVSFGLLLLSAMFRNRDWIFG